VLHAAITTKQWKKSMCTWIRTIKTFLCGFILFICCRNSRLYKVYKCNQAQEEWYYDNCQVVALTRLNKSCLKKTLTSLWDSFELQNDGGTFSTAISCLHGAQQQTLRPPVLLLIDGTDRRTPDRVWGEVPDGNTIIFGDTRIFLQEQFGRSKGRSYAQNQLFPSKNHFDTLPACIRTGIRRQHRPTALA